MRLFKLAIILLVGLFFASCQEQVGKGSELKIDYEKYTLDNGLEVILHIDRSDPIASVAVNYHVGSNREKKGRTGFAHLFEHMLFQESQHVAQDQFFKKIQGAGGTLNGFTYRDGTVYYEVVPKNALEMAMWMEADRMGWLLSTVTDEALMNQKDVVQNEKRQRVDNRPYGHASYIKDKLLYPEDHPYNWQVIGELEDIGNASREDVTEFYKKWYGPNNATLVIAGDLDVEQTKKWVEKYFGEIKKGEETTDPEKRNVTLTETKKAYYEDNFARSPQLSMVFPTVPEYTKDAYALNLLSDILSDGKKSPLYKVIVEEKKLAPAARAYVYNSEITSEFHFSIGTFPNTNLADVEAAVFEALARFEKEGFSEKDLDRIKAKLETSFYNSISSIINKSFQLAQYNEYAGSPGFVTEDINNLLSVTTEDIKNVYAKYIKGKHFVMTSVVPKGQAELVSKDSKLFPLKEEKIDMAGASDTSDKNATKLEKIPTAFDRSIEPAKGPAPKVHIPSVWSHTFENGLKIYGIEHSELPLIQFELSLNGGMLLDDPAKIGVANLMTDIMMQGTAKKTPIELEEAIDELGASIRMGTSSTSISLSANMLKSRAKAVTALMEEIMLEPRWDETEFARIKKETTEIINRRKSDPGSIAGNVWNKLLYGSHILANPTYGTKESVEAITIDDLKNFYSNYFSPKVSYIAIVGSINKDEAVALFKPFANKWAAKDVTIPMAAFPAKNSKPELYFVDVPGAKQSQIRIGNLALKSTDKDYYPAHVMNYKLGGSFNGIVNIILREEKGYTYGARTGFGGNKYVGRFVASSAVRSNTTGESVKIFKDEISKYRNGITAEDLTFTQNALIQSNSRRFETLGALLGMITNAVDNNLPFDYITLREKVVQDMTLDAHKALANKYLDINNMKFLVVGDAKTQLKEVEKLGLGKATLLDVDGNKK